MNIWRRETLKISKKARRIYREKYDYALECAQRYIPCKKILGEGGLHIFIELDHNLNARKVLDECIRQNVIFMPGIYFISMERGPIPSV